jgi:hypothetical protein
VFIWFQELRYQTGAFQGMTKWSWPNIKIISTTRVYSTRGPSGPDPRLSGPDRRLSGPGAGLQAQLLGRPARVSGGLAWAFITTCLHEEKPKSVDGAPPGRPASHVVWPPDHHLAPNRPLQVGGGPIHPYKYPLMVKVDTPHSFCSSPLVKVPV